MNDQERARPSAPSSGAERSPDLKDLQDLQDLDPAVRGRLATERIVWLCTLRRNGSPHVTPVWFVFVRGTWWIGADRASVKLRNIEHDPRVSLALEGGEAPVVAEGRARIWHVPPGAEATPDAEAAPDAASAPSAAIPSATATTAAAPSDPAVSVPVPVPVPSDVVAAFLAKYDWDVTATLPSASGHSGRVLFEVPVDRWLLAGTAQ
ncbi:pyridoxamine 5'-phosphate oxidase family protein [Streptomyces chrestomyceticus]|uniref:pyridoxamine 5'-phosphate oxidase family protein n=1 Tax=Streptomyces chrestomyceticus TaxID=68185 RepID=UPI003793458F